MLCSILPMSVWKCWTLPLKPLWNLCEFFLLNWNDWCLGIYTLKACSLRTWHLPVCLLYFSVLPSPYFKAAWLSTENFGHQLAAIVFGSFLWIHCWLTKLDSYLSILHKVFFPPRPLHWLLLIQALALVSIHCHFSLQAFCILFMATNLRITHKFYPVI